MVSTVAGSKGTYKLTVDLTTPTNPSRTARTYIPSIRSKAAYRVAAATGGDTSTAKGATGLTGPGIDAPIPSGKSGA